MRENQAFACTIQQKYESLRLVLSFRVYLMNAWKAGNLEETETSTEM